MRIQFLGATETVTGSRFLVEHEDRRILVDCGLFQGVRSLRLRNREPFPFELSSLDAVVLTHAHLDHSGALPRLIAEGYRGPVFGTVGTRGLCEILLPDSGYLQEEEARYANRKGTSRHHPARPIYTAADGLRAAEAIRGAAFGEPVDVAPGFQVRFEPAGHILGAASVHLRVGGRRIVFSGDLGRPNDLLMKPAAALGEVDVLVMESTYGNRRRRGEDPVRQLGDVATRTFERGGTLLVPSFAVGRAQTLLHIFAKLRATGAIPNVPVYLNSPMAINATELFLASADEHRLSSAECAALGGVAEYTRSVDQSIALSRQRGPMVIISASGMATGGRVLHHLSALAPDPRNTIALVGFQAAGTRGESLANGSDRLKIHGSYVPVRAEVVNVEGLSAHADAGELVDWARSATTTPSRVFIVHGEVSAADGLRRELRDALGWEAEIPTYGEVAEFGRGAPAA